ncbi:hypothetical protein ABZP36_033377 [Zizania latifolia]
MESAGSETLRELLRAEAELGQPVHIVVYKYNSFLSWALGMARRHSAVCAACAVFLTQACAIPLQAVSGTLGLARCPCRSRSHPVTYPGFRQTLRSATCHVHARPEQMAEVAEGLLATGKPFV